MIDRLVIATGNPGKAKEIAALLDGVARKTFHLKDFPPVAEPEETGETFEANALIKARYYAEAFGMPCVADDSGLAVDALGGKPGVFSARYAGPGATDPANNERVLREMAQVPDAERTARFVCCAVYVPLDGDPIVEQAAVEGRLAHHLAGTNGFGYDPMFIPNGYNETFGVLDTSVKQAISHRAKAFTALRNHILNPT